MTVGAMASIVVGYLVGSVDFAVIASRMRGVDIYQLGSGNPGTANVLRHMGWKVAGPVMLGDIAKGAVAAAIGRWLGGEVIGHAAALAAVVGHCYPVWHRFKGGKGVATALGAMLVLHPLIGLGMAVIWGSALAISRISSVGSLVAVVGMTPAVAVSDGPSWAVLWTACTAVLVILRHHENIRRLLAGDERPARADIPGSNGGP